MRCAQRCEVWKKTKNVRWSKSTSGCTFDDAKQETAGYGGGPATRTRPYGRQREHRQQTATQPRPAASVRGVIYHALGLSFLRDDYHCLLSGPPCAHLTFTLIWSTQMGLLYLQLCTVCLQKLFHILSHFSRATDFEDTYPFFCQCADKSQFNGRLQKYSFRILMVFVGILVYEWKKKLKSVCRFNREFLLNTNFRRRELVSYRIIWLW